MPPYLYMTLNLIWAIIFDEINIYEKVNYQFLEK